MRTTIEISDEQRSRLLAIAAARGEKGFSGVVREAIDHYLQREAERSERVEAALEVMGSLSDADADAMLAEAQRLRERWR